MPTIKNYQERDKKAEYAYKFYLNKGYSPQASASIVGNLIHEGGLNTTAEGDKGYKGGSSRGIAQWREDYKSFNQCMGINGLILTSN